MIPPLCTVAVILSLWTAATFFFGAGLVPSPLETLRCLAGMAMTGAMWEHTLITLSRGVLAIAMSLAVALVLGVGAGLSRTIMSLGTPLVAVLQATPPILWISLLMVWVGAGNTVPVVVVMAALFPPLFLNVAQSVAALDQRLFAAARVYRVGRMRILMQLILPGIFPHVLAGLTYALGSGWKIAAVAEFLGSSKGIGAQIYWAYRLLNMPELFAWALILVGLGVGLEFTLVRTLRRKAEGSSGHA